MQRADGWILARTSLAMDKYRRVERPAREEDAAPGEVRVTQQGKVRKYVSYASALLSVRALRVSRAQTAAN